MLIVVIIVKSSERHKYGSFYRKIMTRDPNHKLNLFAFVMSAAGAVAAQHTLCGIFIPATRTPIFEFVVDVAE